MRLTEVSLQGYKSFAARHRFAFPSPITAIIGPNGSGKSNIADAIRWALGEQRSASLRARRNEDLIFAGTDRRARAGLAEVTLTFDNADGVLGVEFPEVVICRRVHRDGAAEYMLNGARVRLRDLSDLLGTRLGDADYAVIGQGMVDSALTLRPEERRALIDEAAGVAPLQRKRDRALRQLAETEENRTRVNDILAEIGPRLRRMSRLGERARRYEERASEMAALLATWYGHHWRQAVGQLRSAAEQAADASGSAEASDLEASTLEEALAEARQAAAAADADVAAARSERERLLAELAAARQHEAVALAQGEAAGARLVEARADATSLADELAALDERASSLESAVTESEAVLAARDGELEAARSALARREAEQAEAAERLEAARLAAFEAASRVASRRNDHTALTDAAQVLDRELSETAAERDRLIARVSDDAAAVALQEAELEASERSLHEIVESERSIDAELKAATAALGDARAALARSQARLDALNATARTLADLVERLDPATVLLARLVGEASADASVAVGGRVAAMLQIDGGWEKAVVAALGGQLSGLVVSDRRAVDDALSRIPADAPGPVALVPIGEAAPPWPDWRPAPGERPVADVARSPSSPELAARLLGHTAFVSDLEAARAAVARPDGPLQAVTRDGTLVLRSATVLAGTPGEQLVSIQRDLQAIPADVAAATAEAERCAAEADDLAERRRRLEGDLGRLADERSRSEARRREAREAVERARLQAERSGRELAWQSAAVERLTGELEAAGREIAALEAAIDAAEREEREASQALEAMRAPAAVPGLADLRAVVAAAGAAASDAARMLAGRRAQAGAARAQAESLATRCAESQRRAESLAAAAELHREQAERHAGDISRLAEALAAHDLRASTAASSAEAAHEGLQRAIDELDEARAARGSREAQLGELRVSVARAEDRVVRLYDQMRADGEWFGGQIDLAEELDPAAPPDLDLPAVDPLPEGLDDRIAAIRRELRAIGAIDREALAEYESTAERHALLASQQADLDAAGRDLREVLTALEAQIEARFEEAFAEVARAFSAMFTQLFGGGEAELVTIEGESEEPGIEIVARPPGKRRQPLSLLSGGERSLTAVALIFALLKVSRTPFVVLDEVDAALDEANIDRFGEALERLADDTQVIIVTHNRGTIQRAGAVYGVTMGEDGASQVISMRVEPAN